MSHRSVRSTIAFALVIAPFRVVSAAHRLASVHSTAANVDLTGIVTNNINGALVLQFAETQ